MAIRSRKPTSPGRRFQTTSDFSEITKSTPGEVAARPAVEERRPQRLRPQDVAPPRWRPQARSTASIDFKRIKDGVTAKVAAIEYDPNRTCRIALLHYADGEKAYILAPKGLHGRRPRAERPGRRHQAGQRPAAALHPGRHHRAQRRAAPRRQGGKIGPLGRHGRAAGRQGRRVRHPAPARPPRCAAC